MQSPSWNLVWANPAFLKGLDRWGLPSWFLESMLSCWKVQLWDHWTKWLKICCCSLETMIICAYTYPIVFPVHVRKPSHWYLKIYILFWRLQLWLRAKSTTPSQVDSWSHVPHVLWGQHSRINQSLYQYPCQFFFWQVFPTSFSSIMKVKAFRMRAKDPSCQPWQTARGIKNL